MNTSGQGNWMDKHFHKKLSNFEVSPEKHVWEGIVKKLNESQKRPGLFGNWWTVLLTIIMLLLVSGVGAYMLYKKAYQQKTEKKQNKDLPNLEDKKYDDGTAFINSSGIKTEISTPHRGNKLINQQKGVIQTKPTLKNEITNRNSVSQVREPIQISEAKLNDAAIETSFKSGILPNTTSWKANDLIASVDNTFYSLSESNNKEFSYSYLPLKESYLKKENEQLTSPILLDGCNVYKDKKTHFFLDVYYAPEIANRSLESKDPALQSYVADRANSEKPILSYSAGVKASFVFGNGLSVRGGLSYSNNSERFDFIKETQEITTVIKDQNGNVIGTEIKKVVIMDKIYNRYTFLDIPIMVGYEKDLKDFVLSVNGGIGLNLFASQTGKIYKDDKNKMSFYLLENNGEANEPIFRNTAGVSLIGSIGLNYKYNERIMLLLEPSARYYMRSLSDPSNPVSQKYLFLGINVGLRYRIK